MADFDQELRKAILVAVSPVFQAFQGAMPLGEMRDSSIEVIREYFYFGLQEKLCSKCHVMKEKKAFGIDTSKPDGLFAWCRECRAAGYKKKHEDANV